MNRDFRYMQDVGTRTICKQNMMFLPQDLTDHLRLVEGSLFSLLPMGSIVILRLLKEDDDKHQHYFTTSMDLLGRIEIPKVLREAMGWDCKERYDISVYYVDDEMVILQKYVNK